MPYISRDEHGKIVELHDSPATKDAQRVESNHPDALEFLKSIVSQNQAKQELTNTDSDMVRVVEDLIDLLMKKQVFIFTELPEAVQTKLNARRKLRKDINSLEGLIKDDDGIF